jgi:hypothetical protein
MTSFEIDILFNREINLSIFCIECGKYFSSELDINYSDDKLPTFNKEIFYCHFCNEPHKFTLEVENNNLTVTSKDKNISGGLSYSNNIEMEELPYSTPQDAKAFYDLQIERLLQILNVEINKYIVDQSLNRLIYSGIITSLETYLNEVLISIVFSSECTLEKFVNEYEPYKKEQLSLNEIFLKFNYLENKVRKDLNNLIYHNIPKIIRIFNIFDFELDKFSNIKNLVAGIQKRHSLIHRSGVDENDGSYLEVSKEEIILLIKETNSFVNYINQKVEEKCYLKDFPDIVF